MPNLNKVFLIGNLTRDPEVRYTPKGVAVVDFELAINRAFAGGGGDRNEHTTFIDITLWARLAEIAREYLKKGNPVFVEGALHMDIWDDKQTGQKRSRLRVIGEALQLLNTRPYSNRDESEAPRKGDARASQRPTDPDPNVEPRLDSFLAVTPY